MRRDGLEIERRVDFGPNETPVRVLWHSKINQVRAR